MRKPLRIVQHAGYPEMIESTVCAGCINRTEHEGNRVAGTVESRDFDSPEIIGFDGPTQLSRFHNQRGKLCHSGADIETAATSCEFPPQHYSNPAPETVTEPPLRSPELIAAFITVDRSQYAIVETAIDLGYEAAGRRSQRRATRLQSRTPAICIAVATTVSVTPERNSRFRVSTVSVSQW